jgi:GH15 family glucan-1,4-alpha-glucosidase
MFGVGGERRLTEIELPALRGYGGARPVRVGNQASSQLQLDAYGELLNQAWRWYERGHEPDDDYWRFLHELVETAVERWSEPDSGLWEWRQHLQHFVHSKAMCWVAVDRGLALAEACMRKAPVARWRRTRDEIREAVDAHGYDADRGIFVQAFGSSALDAALLLLPGAGYIAFEDERMVRTTDAIRDELDDDGLLRRYRREDEFEGEEGAFLACSFWLVECLVRQGRGEDARAAFDRAYATANDLGLFSEEFDTNRQTMLGNFPQALTHLSQIAAAVALAEHDPAHAGAAAPIR